MEETSRVFLRLWIATYYCDNVLDSLSPSITLFQKCHKIARFFVRILCFLDVFGLNLPNMLDVIYDKHYIFGANSMVSSKPGNNAFLKK